MVEVVSDESLRRDRTDKFYEYQEDGVREYRLIDPRPGKERADFWVLDNARYRPEPITGDGIYRSTVIPGFWLRVDWLWAGLVAGPARDQDQPDPMMAFAEIAGLPPAVLEALQQAADRGPALP